MIARKLEDRAMLGTGDLVPDLELALGNGEQWRGVKVPGHVEAVLAALTALQA
ncbi:MAG TPA: hypothetical protein VFG21_03245 [Xanthomonadaceae bacterium]|nr:hypothetical protein [Xanthomonadaceae bacterium]